MKPKIFAFINGAFGGGNVVVIAVAEDGTFLASHASSNEGWAKHDIGLTSNWKHERYDAHYPGGWEMEWIDDPRLGTHPGLDAAYALNQATPAPTNSEVSS